MQTRYDTRARHAQPRRGASSSCMIGSRRLVSLSSWPGESNHEGRLTGWSLVSASQQYSAGHPTLATGLCDRQLLVSTNHVVLMPAARSKAGNGDSGFTLRGQSESGKCSPRHAVGGAAPRTRPREIDRRLRWWRYNWVLPTSKFNRAHMVGLVRPVRSLSLGAAPVRGRHAAKASS